ncbi:major facilitator superfamily domain-containing protein [Mycena alexandri]|uniref:Major facilitator superfamily domain-containing protein n=1 Tax=Mycena alexandri TaxID=1745969 RepID=A0AAD6SBP4_9AGAR|nr:major facilitator superfamily domain-containing protein [Mycena alexandri]
MPSSITDNSPTPTIREEKPVGDDLESGGTSKLTSSLEPPDGGLDAWLTILGTSMVSFATFGIVNGYGAFNDYYETTYLSNYSATLISLIGAIQAPCLTRLVRDFLLLYTLLGVLHAYVGPRYIIPASGVISAFALFMLSITKPQQIYQQYLTQAILFSLGATFSFFPSFAVCAHWFKRRIAFAMGFPAAAASLGGVLYPIMLERLIPRIGFGWTIRVLAFVVLLCFIIATFTIKVRRPAKPLPRLSQLLAFRAFRDPIYLCLCLGGWFSVTSTFNPFFYVSVYGSDANGGPSFLTPYYLSIMTATAILGRIAPGFIADRVGKFNVIAVSTTLSGVLILALWYTSSAQPNLIAFAAIYGVVSGPFFAVLSRSELASEWLSSSSALAGTPIGGVFISNETLPNFRHLILFSGVIALVGSGFFWVARFIRSRKLFEAILNSGLG